MARGIRVTRALLVAACAILGGLAAGPMRASALAPPTPWDGSNPFHCTVQDAGQGTVVPDPDADPYCVHFDKTNQNISQLGVVDFLLKEPARVAAALPKCFYYQEDHWRGSVIQSDLSTVLYEFTGHYFFDEATGDGGAWVTGFSVAGQTFDPTSLPGFPAAYGPFFGPGTGGVITHNAVPANPRCVALAQGHPGSVYSASASVPRCIHGGGAISENSIGPVTLGLTEDRLRALFGPPGSVKRGFLGYCVTTGGVLLVGEPGDRSGAFGSGDRMPAVILVTTSHAFVLQGHRGRRITAGESSAALRRAFPGARMALRVGSVRVLRLGRGLLAGVAHSHVAYLAAYDPRAIRSRSALHSFLRRSR